MTGAGFPWSVLEIEPSNDSEAIRRAYARRLRSARPDEDAQAFQNLVEARDLALRLAVGAPMRVLATGVLPAPPAASHERANPAAVASDMAAPDDAGSRDSPSRVLATFTALLDEPQIVGWQEVISCLGALSIQERQALEGELLTLLNAHLTKHQAAFAGEVGSQAPILGLLAALDAEFDWRGGDRVLYEVLGRDAAEEFVFLLDWASTSGKQISGGAMPTISRHDLYHFFDRGKDREGVAAYRLMQSDPRLWHEWDVGTLVFDPLWALSNRRYGLALLGFTGWAALLLMLVLVLVTDSDEPWSTLPAAAIIVTLFHDSIRYGRRFGETNLEKLPLQDWRAAAAFPLWALIRKLYVHAAAGVTAWIVLIMEFVSGAGQPVYSFPKLAAVLVVATLHVHAGTFGRNWVVKKLIRGVRNADRRHIFDPVERGAFLYRHGTREPALFTWIARVAVRGGAMLVGGIVGLIVLAGTISLLRTMASGHPEAVLVAVALLAMWKYRRGLWDSIAAFGQRLLRRIWRPDPGDRQRRNQRRP